MALSIDFASFRVYDFIEVKNRNPLPFWGPLSSQGSLDPLLCLYPFLPIILIYQTFRFIVNAPAFSGRSKAAPWTPSSPGRCFLLNVTKS